MIASSALLALSALALAAGGRAAEPLSIHALVRVGDGVGSGASVTGVGSFDVGGREHWAAVVSLDAPHVPQALLRDGHVQAVWGQPTGVPGVQLRDIHAPQLNDAGRVSWPALVEPIFIHLSGLFLSGKLVLLGGDAGQAPGLPPGLQFRLFQAVRTNAGEAVVACDLEHAVPTRFHQVLMRLTPTAGGAPAQSLVAQTGDLLPGMSGPVALLADSLEEFDLNRRGEVLFVAGTADGVPWVFRDDALVIRGGDPVGPLGLALERVNGLATNDAGDWALAASLRSGGTLLDAIVRNGEALAVEGDALAALPGATLVTLGWRIELTGGGQVLWRGRWDEPDSTRDEGLFVDRRLVVREGVTTIDGQVLTALGTAAIDDAARSLLFTGGLGPGATPYDALFRADLP